SDHYRVIKLLGEGSYGKVILAVHKKRGTLMALKFFPRDSTSLLSFLREYNLSLAFCTHPSLTSALGIVFSTPNHYVFAQQPGLYGDLYDVIIPEMGLAETCVQRVASQISGALSHLHSLGFVHRDVKPENIFLCDRDCRWVKLGDFGMVKAVGTRVPCVWYSSPYCTPEAEIARKKEETESGKCVLVSVEASTDSWALGILIYAMLMGRLPWAESILDNVAYKEYLGWREQERTLTEMKGLYGIKDGCQVAQQFRAFTPLACSLFQAFLHPEPKFRATPEKVPGFLGEAWLLSADISG
uniref:Si:ch211-171h4.3 n=1 Tax=Electrophorus electricus TaxID=8005 RepID=A0A4W4HLE9_ELEEL